MVMKRPTPEKASDLGLPMIKVDRKDRLFVQFGKHRVAGAEGRFAIMALIVVIAFIVFISSAGLLSALDN